MLAYKVIITVEKEVDFPSGLGEFSAVIPADGTCSDDSVFHTFLSVLVILPQN